MEIFLLFSMYRCLIFSLRPKKVEFLRPVQYFCFPGPAAPAAELRGLHLQTPSLFQLFSHLFKISCVSHDMKTFGRIILHESSINICPNLHIAAPWMCWRRTPLYWDVVQSEHLSRSVKCSTISRAEDQVSIKQEASSLHPLPLIEDSLFKFLQPYRQLSRQLSD